MKTIKQIISDADPRLKGVLVIMVVYVMVMATTVTSGATQEIKGYKETIEIPVSYTHLTLPTTPYV